MSVQLTEKDMSALLSKIRSLEEELKAQKEANASGRRKDHARAKPKRPSPRRSPRRSPRKRPTSDEEGNEGKFSTPTPVARSRTYGSPRTRTPKPTGVQLVRKVLGLALKEHLDGKMLRDGYR